MKQEVASSFLEKFQLKVDEIKVLRGHRDGSLHEVISWVTAAYSAFMSYESLLNITSMYPLGIYKF